MTCPDCQNNNPYCFNWKNVCCRVRFLVDLPGKEVRGEWIRKWEKQGDHDMCRQVKAELRRIWAERAG